MDRLDFVPLLAVLWFDLSPTKSDGGGVGGSRALGPGLLLKFFPRSSEITLRNAQVRRISWVRRVRPVGARLSGLLVSAAFRPATYSSMAIRHIDAPHMNASVFYRGPKIGQLFDFGFFEFDVLARDRIV